MKLNKSKNKQNQRLVLELVGLAFLIIFSYRQRQTIFLAIESISDAKLGYVITLYLLYWINIPLTALNYRLISKKKLPILGTSLAQLAGSGPGRIIPGGVGHIGVASLYLSKNGLPVEKAFAVTVANNLIGTLVNGVMLLFALIYSPEIFVLLINGLNANHLVIFAVSALIVFGLFQWLMHVRRFRKVVRKTLKYWNSILVEVSKNFGQLALICILATTITAIHLTMLILAGKAISQDVPLTYATIALSAGVTIGGILPTPGGLGGVEAGIFSTLLALGYDAQSATTIAILYRSATYWQPLLPGTIAYFYLKSKKQL